MTQIIEPLKLVESAVFFAFIYSNICARCCPDYRFPAFKSVEIHCLTCHTVVVYGSSNGIQRIEK